MNIKVIIFFLIFIYLSLFLFDIYIYIYMYIYIFFFFLVKATPHLHSLCETTNKSYTFYLLSLTPPVSVLYAVICPVLGMVSILQLRF